jgi:demethylmenaquinone methyltransferase / 2-methoxy-6-polyprenyl-1,4-benzoquinol methylase
MIKIENSKDDDNMMLFEAADVQNLDRRNLFTRRLFDGIAKNYDRPAQLFSFFQYLHWRDFLVSRLRLNSNSRVLDVCTGPGGVAIAIARKARCRVVGVDISDGMLQKAQSNIINSNLASYISVKKARAEELPFDDHAFDAVVFTFLYRYIEQPQDVLIELTRVLKPGGQIASLEFYVPGGPVLYPLWLLHTRLVLPVGTRFITPGWKEVGSFLGPSISDFFRRKPLSDIARMWSDSGINDVQTKILSWGGAFVMWGNNGDRLEK